MRMLLLLVLANVASLIILLVPRWVSLPIILLGLVLIYLSLPWGRKEGDTSLEGVGGEGGKE